jgi:hypothetical protein
LWQVFSDCTLDQKILTARATCNVGGCSEAIRRLEVAIQPQSYSLIQRMASASHFDADT